MDKSLSLIHIWTWDASGKDKQTCVFPQENAGLVISGNSQNGIARPAMLVGAAARHAAPTTPLCLRISYHRARWGVKRKPAKDSLRFIGSVAKGTILLHPLAV